MAYETRRVDYFHTTVRDEPGAAYELLHTLAEAGIDLLAFTAVPAGPMRVQLMLFPEDARRLRTAAEDAGMELEGPHPALLVQGDDELGALATLHAKLFGANVSVYASAGIADGRGSYAYLIYVRPEDAERAAAALRE